MTRLRGRVLAIAGSDSSGGAGIQADVKTITALGAYASTALTALTVQNTLGVQEVLPIPPNFLARQIEAVLDDIGADAVKTGMLADAPAIECVCDTLQARAPNVPLVVDPVMVAKGGARLLANEANAVLERRLLPMATVLTPNLPEAEVLAGMNIPHLTAMRRAAAKLLMLGAPAVLLKGGHLPGETVIDLLATKDGIEEFASPRIASIHTHGTGCTLASALASGLAQGLSLREAVVRARLYTRAAIASAPGLGAGHGPLNHAVTVDLAALQS
jgi:hydroxymethylpyrimidine/phosphomethylpyrimidine kinase